MPWSKRSSTPKSNPDTRHSVAVPSSDTVRQAALRASWARDHRVARRRLAFRWLLWAWWRIGLPVLVALALAVWWLLWQMPLSGLPAWLKPMATSVHSSVTNASRLLSATSSLPSENALHSKEP